MKHKSYKTWILENPPLNQNEKKQLSEHLADCPQCRQLHTNWLKIEELIINASIHKPAPGFSKRWHFTLAKRREQEKTNRVRRTLIAIVLLMMTGSLVYFIQNNLFMNWLVVALNASTSFFIAITKGLAGIGNWMSEKPAAAFSVGFLLFGFAVAFLMAGVFTLWQVLKREHAENAIFTEE